MADLATVADLESWLQIKSGSETATLTRILDSVEDLLERLTGQTFAASGAVTDELHDGTGSILLWVDRPVQSWTSVKIGTDPSNPDETVTDQSAIIADGRRLMRRDGKVFTLGVMNVRVTYTAASNLPELAKLAVLEAGAYMYRRRGKEHVRSMAQGEFGNFSLMAELDKLPIWSKAVATLSVPNLA